MFFFFFFVFFFLCFSISRVTAAPCVKLAVRKSALNPRWFILLIVLRRWSRCWSYFCCFVIYSTRRFVLCLAFCYFVLVFFGPFGVAVASLGEERASLGAFRTFVIFALVWFCLFPSPLGVWDGLRFAIEALTGLFSYPYFALLYIN